MGVKKTKQAIAEQTIAPNKYDLENLPISQKTRDGLTPDNINYIGAIGRMLLVQDKDFNERFDKLMSAHVKHDRKLDKLAGKIELLEERIDGLTREFAEHKICVSNMQHDIIDIKDRRLAKLEEYANPKNTSLRYAVVIIISLLFATIIFLILFYNLPHPASSLGAAFKTLAYLLL